MEREVRQDKREDKEGKMVRKKDAGDGEEASAAPT